MISFNIFLIGVFANLTAMVHSVKLLFQKDVSCLHKIISANVGWINLLYLIMSIFWQSAGLDYTPDYNPQTIEYWAWTYWEFHVLALSVYSLIKIEKMYE